MGNVAGNLTISQGTAPATPTEQLLAKLCAKSFLSLWSYSRVFNDKKDNPNAQQGKEIVDLLVVFGKSILLFSDKKCLMGNSGNLKVDWDRWTRKAINKSAQQLYGAENWIRRFPKKIFLDPEFTKPLPVALPPINECHFHRIIVAHGARERCINELGQTGSLMISSEVETHDIPFMVGQQPGGKGFLHVFDEENLSVVMKELDTISDFVQYLEKKEHLVESGIRFNAVGEEELLAFYLGKVNDSDEHDFILSPGANAFSVDIGFWDSFKNSEARKSRIKADEVSYTWDDLIEKFNYHALTGTSYKTPTPGIENHEKILRYLAAEPRTRRRLLCQNLYALLGKTPVNQFARKLVIDPSGKHPSYVFLLLPRCSNMDHDEYRVMRQELLVACCRVAPLVDPRVREVIGFATETFDELDDRSEDLIYFDARNLTDEEINEAKRIQKESGIFTTAEMSNASALEYPTEEALNKPKSSIESKPNEAKQRNAELKKQRRRLKKKG